MYHKVRQKGLQLDLIVVTKQGKNSEKVLSFNSQWWDLSKSIVGCLFHFNTHL